MTMNTWLLVLMLETRPPGVTHFSVTPVPQCALAEACEGARRSSFYEGWVRQETFDEGKLRYERLVAEQEKAIGEILCVRLDGSAIPGCVPEPVALDKKTKKLLFGPQTAASAMLGAAIPESGLREDVQVGRGFARPCPGGGPSSIPGVCGPSDDGGRGRGPGGEACVMQPHPSEAWRFTDGDPVLLDRARRGDARAREAVMQTLVGLEPENVRRCWRTGLRMLLHSYSHCGWWLARGKLRQDRWYAMYSQYGTGNSCVSSNHGKTPYRYNLFLKLRERARILAKQRP